MVGRGPRDQSSGQKPRARLPEVLACRAALRFKRANGREAGRAGLPRLLLNRGLNPFLGGALDECGVSEHRLQLQPLHRESLFSEKRPEVW